MTSTVEAFEKKKKFLLIFPLIAAPFLFLAFYGLGGGQGDPGNAALEKAAGMGFNTELPAPVFDKKDNGLNKMAVYEKAKKDSLRRRDALRQDPYRSGSRQDPVGGNWLSGSFNPMNAQVGAGVHPNTRINAGGHLNTQLRPEKPTADELLQKLEMLKKNLAEPGRANPGDHGKRGDRGKDEEGKAPVVILPKQEKATPDPELDKLSAMLDKITAIQQGKTPEEVMETAIKDGEVVRPVSGTSGGEGHAGGGVAAAAASVTIPAVVEGDQGLVSGATIGLRLTEEISIGGISIPRGQLVYGQVAINNDRMMVHIGSIRSGQSIYLTSLKLYDLDGLEGIHIPDMLSRQVARQSADQGIGSLNLGAYDPSIGAQATNAGIQAAKSLFSRKIRLVRVTVKDGYRVLLRDTKGSGIVLGSKDTVITERGSGSEIQAPSVDSLEPFMHHSVKEGGIRFMLQGIYLQEGLMWMAFECENRTRIGYTPDRLRCTIREGRRLRRTAVQDVAVEPVYRQLPSTIAGNARGSVLLGFRPFTLGKGKKLAVELGEGNGGRGLEMEISPKLLLHVK